MSCSTIKNFWSNIVGGTTNSSLFLSIELKFSGETEISEFDLHFIVEEKISEFEISVDNSVGVKVLERVDYLDNVTLDLEFHESLSSFDEFVESLVGTKFKQDVDIFGVFEDMLELDDVDVVE